MKCHLQAGDPGKLVEQSPIELEGLRTRKCQWCKSQSKGTRRTMSQLSQAERENETFLCSFVLFRPSVGWMTPCREEQSPLLSLPVQMLFPETISQTRPEIIFNHISGHLLTQSYLSGPGAFANLSRNFGSPSPCMPYS